MPNDPLLVCLPWNTKNYTYIKGFNPLYRFLIQDSTNDVIPKNAIHFITLNEFSYKDYLVKPETKDILHSHIKSVYLTLPMINIKEFHDFWTKFDIRETIVDELNFYDFKIIHTNLFTTGIKPYIYCIEHIEALFSPWINSNFILDKLPRAKIESIKYFLQSTLENPLCMAIISSIPITVEHFKRLFNSNIINNKLHLMSLGIADLSKPVPKKKLQSMRRFIFTTNLQNNINNVSVAEMINNFLFIKSCKKLFPNDHFIFLAEQPDYHILSNYLTESEYNDVVSHNNVIFVGTAYINNNELCKLLSISNYLVMLTPQPDIFFLLTNMRNSIIPITIDLPEIVDYKCNESNALLIKCYDQCEFYHHPIFGLTANEDSLMSQIRNGIPKIIDMLRFLRDNPEKENAIAHQASDAIGDNYEIATARKKFIAIITASYQTFQNINENKELFSRFIKKLHFNGRDRFESLDYFLPSMRTVTSNDFNRHTLFHEILSVGTSNIYTDGQYYLEVQSDETDLPLDAARFSFHNENILHALSQSNFSYDNALEAAFYRIRSSFSIPLIIHIKQKMRLYVTSRSFLKSTLKPIYQFYKKLKFAFE